MVETQSKSFTVMQAELPELELVVPLFDQYRMFYGKQPDRDIARRFLRARMEHRDSIIFIAVEDRELSDEALGFSLLYPSFNSVAALPIWILNDLYVAEKARRRGVGRALVERGRQLAVETGARGMSLDTARNNDPACRLYEALGFKKDELFCTYLLDL